MANTTVVPGSAPAPKNVFSRFVGIITAPKATFESVAAHPKWLGMLLLTATIIAIGAALPMTTDAGKQAALDQQVKGMEQFGFQVTDEMYERMQKGTRILPYSTGITLFVISPIMTVIITGILFAIFNAALGGTARFKQLFAVVVHSGVISALALGFTGPLNYLRGAVTSATSLSVLLPMFDDTTFIGRLAGMVDLFRIWGVVVLAIGLGALYKRRTQPIAIAFFAVYAAIALIAATAMSFFGGRAH